MAEAAYTRHLLTRYFQRYSGRLGVLDADRMAARLEERAKADIVDSESWRNFVIETASRERISLRWGACR